MRSTLETVESDAADTPFEARYAFRMGSGGPVVLIDTTIYVGRKPAAPRIRTTVNPRLVSVPSPLGEVSGTHLQVHQHGSSIVVTDLRSTNGSIVVVPGRDPRALLQGESMVVTPGTLVDIGDGNIIEILPVQRVRGD